MPQTTTKPMDVPAAVRLLHGTLDQWRAALSEGADLNEYRALLAADLEAMQEATRVIADWAFGG